MNSSPSAGLKVLWQQVLTPQSRYLILLQLGLCAARLLMAGGPLPQWFVELPSNAFKASSAGIEVALLSAFLLQWCAWSELLYSLRLTYQPTETSRGSPWRRFAMHIYGGFVFLVVLSALATLHPLLGIGAMFLLFMCGEAQERKLASRPIPMALLKGMGRSYRLISHEPWHFLASLLFPGMVLYAAGVLLVWMRLEGVHWLVLSGLLALWLGFFMLAQLKVALRAEGELDVDVLMGEESGPPHPSSPASLSLKALLTPFDSLGDGLATFLALAMGGWLLFKLGDSGLLSTHALGMAFSAMVRLLSGTVSAFLSLLVKLGFISVVGGVITIVLMLIIGFGRREPLKPLQKVTGRLQGALQRLAGAFSDLNFARGATLGLGTLLTALGTVAVQTYDRVQKDQERQNIVRETLQRQQQKEEEATQARLQRNESLVSRIQQRVGEIRREETPAVREQLLSQLLSDLRDVLPELKTIKGGVDGERKGKLLRYLYESGLLDPGNTSRECRGAIESSQIEMPTKEVQQALKKAKCKTALFLHTMDFSGASLEGAYLKSAFLPFVNLKDANLRGAKLKETTLRYANLENTDLSGADLTGSDLADSILVGANLSNIWSADGYPPLINGAVAFYAVYQPSKDARKNDKTVISWDLVKGDRPGQNLNSFWSFCPLDPQSSLTNVQPSKSGAQVAQAGSKCRNRRFEPQTQSQVATQFIQRDWSGSSFKQSTLKGMTLRQITLAGADLSGAIFEDMVLQDVSFAGANLQDSVFRESVLDNVDFTGANLNGFRIERARRLRNPIYQGSLIDLDENKSFSPYRKNVLRHQIYESRLFSEQNVDDVSLFRQNFLAPLLLSPLPLRPQQLLYWMLAYPLPGAILSSPMQP